MYYEPEEDFKSKSSESSESSESDKEEEKSAGESSEESQSSDSEEKSDVEEPEIIVEVSEVTEKIKTTPIEIPAREIAEDIVTDEKKEIKIPEPEVIQKAIIEALPKPSETAKRFENKAITSRLR